MFISCSPKKKFPQNVPTHAKFDKKINLYSSVENGIQLKHYDTGELYSACKISPLGILDGDCIQYSKDKTVLSKGSFKNGQRHGMWVWNFLTGKPYYKQNFTYGKKRSFWIQTDVWGNEDGIYERYYDLGNLEETGFFDSGYKTGKWEKFFRNKKSESIGHFQKDKKVGEWIFYYPTGKIEAKEVYDKSGKLKKRTTFFEDGKIQCEVANGKQFPDCA